MKEGFILLKSQKKAFWDIIKKNIGNTNGFEFDVDNSTFTISHKDGYYFEFTKQMTNYRFDVLYYPHENSHVEFKTIYKYFESVLEYFSTWTKGIKIEIECDDVWEQPYEPYKIGDGSRTADKFTDQEQLKLKEELEILKQELSNREDLKDSITQIITKLDLLGELVCDLSKTDWRDHLMGSMMGLTVDQVTSAEVAQGIGERLFSLINDTCQTLLG